MPGRHLPHDAPQTAVIDKRNPYSLHKLLCFQNISTSHPKNSQFYLDIISNIQNLRNILRCASNSGEFDIQKIYKLTESEFIALICILLQRNISYDVSKFGSLDEAHPLAPGIWLECIDVPASRLCLQTACRLIAFADQGPKPVELAQAVEDAVDGLLNRVVGDYSSGWIIRRAAENLDIPVRRVAPTGGCWEMGTGAKSVRFISSMFETESYVSSSLQLNKLTTSQILSAAGVNVPTGFPVRTLEEARATADHIGYPVVLKPAAGSRQSGVEVNIRTEGQLKAAFERLTQTHQPILLEQHVPGKSYRVTAASGRVLSVLELQIPTVVGDGNTSVSELIDRENAQPSRGRGKRFPYQPIDKAALRQRTRTPFGDQGKSLTSVPARGEVVELSYFGGGAHGGPSKDVTSAMHPDFHQIIRRIHAFIPIPVCGIDVICKDITQPPTSANYAVNEVNSDPAISMFLREGPRSQSAIELVKATVGERRNLTVPVILIISTPSAPCLASRIAHTLGTTGRRVVEASRRGYALQGKWLSKDPHHSLAGSRRAFCDREADAIVIERFADDAIAYGLGISQVDVLIVAPAADAKDARTFDGTAQIWRNAGQQANIFVDNFFDGTYKNNIDDVKYHFISSDTINKLNNAKISILKYKNVEEKKDDTEYNLQELESLSVTIMNIIEPFF